mmetsp:Transcript_7625/g.11324  ORF Transcript_7625/g.11324 Transcript_7625/m.11324 type:complete len:126 (+) Transcript_7625:272-649(+)
MDMITPANSAIAGPYAIILDKFADAPMVTKKMLKIMLPILDASSVKGAKALVRNDAASAVISVTTGIPENAARSPSTLERAIPIVDRAIARSPDFSIRFQWIWRPPDTGSGTILEFGLRAKSTER